MAKRLNKTKTSRKLDILITTDFYAPHPGGVENYVATLTSFFPEHKITILTFMLSEYESSVPKVERHGNITIQRIPSRSFVGGAFRSPKGFFNGWRKSLDLEPHDVVITNTRFFSTTRLGRILAREWNVPLIHIEHGNRHAPHENPCVQFTAWFYDQTLGRLALHAADRVVCISKKGIPFAKKLGARSLLVIPNAIDNSAYDAAIMRKRRVAFRTEYNISANARAIVFVGRLIRAKGVQELIEAISRARANSNKLSKSSVPDVLIVVGDGSAAKEFVELADKFNVRAVFVGNQDANGVRDALAAADLFVNPSWSEGMPTSVLEALAARVPVIATDVGGTAELLPASHLVPPHNVDALTKALNSKAASERTALPKGYTLDAARKAWRELINHG